MVSKQAERIAITLRARIRDGSWPVNHKVPPERILANNFEVARNTVRRALEMLVDEGLISREVGRGTFVTALAARTAQPQLSQFAASTPADLIEVRMAIEPYAAAAAAVRASPQALAEIEARANACADVVEPGDWFSRDSRFHQAIAAAAGNKAMEAIVAIAETEAGSLNWQQTIKARKPFEVLRARQLAQHADLVNAIRSGDANHAFSLMIEHLCDESLPTYQPYPLKRALG